MRNFTKGLMGLVITAGVIGTTPAQAGIQTPTAPGYHKAEASADFYRKRGDRRYYARGDQPVRSDTRIWRGNDGRYYCKRDNGTTGLLIGAAVGGVAGHEIAGRGDKTLGVVLGAGAGALLGREIDRSNARCR